MKREMLTNQDRPVVSVATTREKVSSRGGRKTFLKLGATSLWGVFAPVGLSFSVAIGVLVFITRDPLSLGNKTACLSAVDTSRLRPVAFRAEEIFLPKALIELAHDESLRGILRDRKTDRLDDFLDRHGLRTSWFLVRYRGTDAEGAPWKGTHANFECKRYHPHSALSELAENKRANFEVFARAMARAAGLTADTIVMPDKIDESIVFITYYDSARIIPIPGNADYDHISRSEIESWTKASGM